MIDSDPDKVKQRTVVGSLTKEPDTGTEDKVDSNEMPRKGQHKKKKFTNLSSGSSESESEDEWTPSKKVIHLLQAHFWVLSRIYP